MSNPSRPRFHLAFPVNDIAEARRFYGGLLGCPEGRSAENWVDFDLYGHQIVAHHAPDECTPPPTGAVDGHQVPCRHFGLLLEWSDWENLAAKFRDSGTEFVIEPYVRFEGLPGEQGTFFVRDPAGNNLEFKSFRNDDQIFAR